MYRRLEDGAQLGFAASPEAGLCWGGLTVPPPQLPGFLQGGWAAWDRPSLCCGSRAASACRVLPLGTLGCFHGNRTADCASKKRLNLLCVELGWVCGAGGSHRGGARRGKEVFAGFPLPPAPLHFPEVQGLHCFGCRSEVVAHQEVVFGRRAH